MRRALEDLQRDAAAVSARLDALRESRRHLVIARDEEDHQARRLKDALERQGGRSADTESRLSLLDEGRRLTAKALAAADKEVAGLTNRLAALSDEIAGLNGD